MAHYEYGPFGGTIASTGSMKDDFAFRFSTKYLDDDSALYYYGLRYYNPELGRWVNRDPIEERGGMNVYGFVGNLPSMLVDRLGLFSVVFKPDGVEEGFCGNYVMFRGFEVTKSLGESWAPIGWLIQEVLEVIKVYDCEYNEIASPKLHFFEAWKYLIITGLKETDQHTQPKDYGICTKGFGYLETTMAWHNQTGSPPYPPGPGWELHPGHERYDAQIPPGVTGLGPGDASAFRRVVYSWDCCPNKTKTRF